MTRIAPKFALTLLCLAAVAAAPTAKPDAKNAAKPALRSNPVVVARFVEHLRDTIELGTLPDGTPMARETAEERKVPILPLDTARRFFDYGVLTGGIESCGGDWEKMGLAPFKARVAAMGLTPKQQGFAVRIHEAAREQGNDVPEDECSPEFKAVLTNTLKGDLAAL